jgi:DNA-binding GntR family transcriptional regulator
MTLPLNALLKGLDLNSRATHMSAAQRVYENVRHRIVTLDLPPDTTLSRGELAQEYGVSQTPLREAMQMLEQDGLIRIYPQSRTVVTRIEEREMQEAHFLRVALECEVVRRLAETPDSPAVEQARAFVKMQETLAKETDQYQMFDDLDKAMHRALFEGVGMLNLYHLLARKLGDLARCQRLELHQAGKMQQILEAHKAIIKALMEGDPDSAVLAMRDHVSVPTERVKRLRRDYPEFFSPLTAE